MGKCKKVQMLRDNEIIREFRSITDAATFIGCVPSTISKICGRKNKAYNGYKFKYAEYDLI